MTLFGTDSSQRVDAARLHSAGALFSYPRCISEASDGSIDRAFRPQVRADRAAGRISGGYDFLTSGVGERHARLFLEAASGFIETGPFLAILDLERSRFRDHATWDDVVDWFRVFREGHPTHPVGIYTGFFWFPKLDVPAGWRRGLGPVYWVMPWYPVRKPVIHDIGAHYASLAGDRAEQWGKERHGMNPGIWQFAGTCRVDDQSVDLNAFTGTREELLVLAGGQAPVHDADEKRDEKKPDGRPPRDRDQTPGGAACPREREHVVVRGETLIAIAEAHGTTFERIKAFPANRQRFGDDWGLIRPGDLVRVR